MNPIVSTDSNRIVLHLSDRTLSSIYSSPDHDKATHSREVNLDLTQASALTSLTSVAVTAYDALLRFGTGTPESIMIETKSSGPVLLSAFLNQDYFHRQEELKRNQYIKTLGPNERTPDLLSKSQSTGLSHKVKDSNIADRKSTNYVSPPLPPMLIASVVARNSNNANEANKAIKNLVKAGRECQRAWIKEHSEGNSLTQNRTTDLNVTSN